MNKSVLAGIISLLEQSVASLGCVTCRQLLTVLYAEQAGGISQKELARKLGVTEGAVSRNYETLGPEGTKCLSKKNGLVMTDKHMSETLNELFQGF